MNTRLFLLAFALVVIALASTIAEVAAQASSSFNPATRYNYVTKVPAPSTIDPAQPQILEIDLTAQQLSAPGPVAARVLTSPNVTTVYVHVEGQTYTIPLVDNGRFEVVSTLPDVPPAMKGRTYTFDFEAVTADQKRTHADVPIFITP